jgi:PAS domain S-box-containing protein
MALSAFDVTQPWSMDDSLPLGLYLMETLSGRVLYANRRFCELGGIEALEEALRQGEAMHAHVLQHWRPASNVGLFFLAPMNPTGQVPSELQESEVVLPSGRTIRRLITPMRNLAGEAPCQLYVFEDVTERKRTEDALRRSELGFRKLIESAPDGVFVHRHQRFIYANPSLLKALRYTDASEIIGRPVWEIVHPDDLPLVRQRVSAVVDRGQTAPLREIRYLRKDGSWFDAESTGLSIEFNGVESVVVMARDITERKRMQSQLLHNDRMALMGTLAAGVGHEINNPLSYVIANLTLALESLPAGEGVDPELKELLQEALEGASRVRNIVRDLKSLSRQAEEQKSSVDVREALDFSIKLATSELRHRAQLVKQYEPVPPVHADASRLGQVFLNLLMNAAQAIPEGNTAAHRITVRVRRDISGRVAVDVSDTGAGIPPDVMARIFDPFFTTKPVGTGTGLGLSICHGIITGMGGEITVHSELGRGTTFTVLLSAVSSEPAVPIRNPTSSS